MLGVFIIKNIYSNLSEKGRNRFLGDIFDNLFVSISSFDIVDNKVYIKLFDGLYFYQYRFLIIAREEKVLFTMRKVSRLGISYELSDYDEFKINLLNKIFVSKDEADVYRLLKLLL